MKELKDMTLRNLLERENRATVRPRKNIVMLKSLRALVAAKVLFYTSTGRPEIADAYQHDFNLTDRMVYGPIDQRIEKLAKKHKWFGRR